MQFLSRDITEMPVNSGVHGLRETARFRLQFEFLNSGQNTAIRSKLALVEQRGYKKQGLDDGVKVARPHSLLMNTGFQAK